MEVLLDGRLMVSREVMHNLLAEKLELPEYYGRNLDALYDMLTQPGKNLAVTVIFASVIKENLGAYGAALVHTMEDAAEENPCLLVKIFNNFSDLEK